MVDLAESVPDHDQIQKGPVQYLYAFALSRRNQSGDRDKAIAILEKVSVHANELRRVTSFSNMMYIVLDIQTHNYFSTRCTRIDLYKLCKTPPPPHTPVNT